MRDYFMAFDLYGVGLAAFAIALTENQMYGFLNTTVLQNLGVSIFQYQPSLWFVNSNYP